LLSRLVEGQQNLLLLRYWIGLSHDDVADALGLPAGTVRRQCSEALAQLRGMLDER
jgi:RNA polymerase sigma-70 factor (ECF subfamily)